MIEERKVMNEEKEGWVRGKELSTNEGSPWRRLKNQWGEGERERRGVIEERKVS